MLPDALLAAIAASVAQGTLPRPGLRTDARGYVPVLAAHLARRALRDLPEDIPGVVLADLLEEIADGTIASTLQLRLALQAHARVLPKRHARNLFFELLYGALECLLWEQRRDERLFRAAGADEVLLLAAGLGRGLGDGGAEQEAHVAHFLLHAAVALAVDDDTPWPAIEERVQARLARWGEEPVLATQIAYAARNLLFALPQLPDDDGSYDRIRAGRQALREGAPRETVHAEWLASLGWRTADRLLRILAPTERRALHRTTLALVATCAPEEQEAQAVALGLVDGDGTPLRLGRPAPGVRRVRVPGGTAIGRSCVLYEAGGTRLVIDMGADPHGRVPAWTPELEALDGVLITHAHQDHIGGLPHLYGELGYDGPWHATATTIACATLALRDGVRLQRAMGGRSPRGDARLVDRVLARARPIACGVPFRVGGLEVTAFEAGHVRGAVQYLLDDAGHRTLVSGDINPAASLSVEPLRYPRVPVEVLVVEGTNLGRDEPLVDGPAGAAALHDAILDAPHRPVLLPVMSLGRAQEVIAALGGSRWRVGVFGLAARMTEATGLRLPENVVLDSRPPDLVRPDEYDVLVASAGGLQGGPAAAFWRELGWTPTVILTGHLFAGTPARVIADGCARIRFSGHASPKHWAKYVARVGAARTFVVHCPEPEAALRLGGVEVPRGDRGYVL